MEPKPKNSTSFALTRGVAAGVIAEAGIAVILLVEFPPPRSFRPDHPIMVGHSTGQSLSMRLGSASSESSRRCASAIPSLS